jgi:hypothetical protein
METLITSAFNNSSTAVAIYCGYLLLKEFPDVATKYIDLWDRLKKRWKK